MPLSEHEQRLLSQMEQQLLAEDPQFASAMRGAARRRSAGRRMLVGGIGVVVGLLLLILAVSLKGGGLTIALGIAAFLVMLAGAGYAVSSPKPRGVVIGPDGRPAPGPARPGPARRAGFMERLEQRWQRRRDQQ